MTNAIWAIGTLLKIGDGASPENFTSIGEITSISGPSLGLDTIEVTNHSSPGGYEEHIGGVLRTGELSMDFNFVPGSATQNATTGLLADQKNRVIRNFQMIFPNSVTWLFSGFVTAFNVDAPFDNKLGASVTIKITGQPTLV